MLSHKIALLTVLFLIPLGLLAYFALTNNDWNLWGARPGISEGQVIVRVNNFPVRASVVTTAAAKQRGLAGRAKLEADEGMLFVGTEPKLQGIWMKDMVIPIDILWLDERGVVVDIQHNVMPETYPEVFYPRSEAFHVLELSANFAELHSVRIGDAVILPNDLK